MNICQSTSAQVDFRQKSAVNDVGREYGQKHRRSEDSRGPMVRETRGSVGYFVEISAEGAQKAGNSKDINNDAQKMINELQGHIKQLENAREQGKTEAGSADVLIKCIQIAMRIMSGDIVPWEDNRYLAEHNPDLYTEAMSRRIPKENPHKHERLSEDEESDASDVSIETGDPAHINSISFDNVDMPPSGV